MDCIPIAEGKSVKSGDSRRHVGGARSAAVKPEKSGRPGQSPLHTMYVARNVGLEWSTCRGAIAKWCGSDVMRCLPKELPRAAILQSFDRFCVWVRCASER